jgi:hypothetical protein
MKSVFLMAVFFLSLTGCQMTRPSMPIRAPMPELPDAMLPELKPMTADDVAAFRGLPESTQSALLENDARLKLSIRTLKAIIDTYNEFARAQNKRNAEALQLPYIQAGEKQL